MTDIRRLQAVLARVLEHLYNPFEPDNQSELYNDVRTILSELTLYTEPQS